MIHPRVEQRLALEKVDERLKSLERMGAVAMFIAVSAPILINLLLGFFRR